MKKSLSEFQAKLLKMSEEEKNKKAAKAFNCFLKIDIDYISAKKKLEELREDEHVCKY